MEIVRFGSEDAANLLAQDPSRMDGLPFGAILVDTTGKILKYNQGESDIAGRSPDQVQGLNFFQDVAPCTKGHEFKGKFDKAVQTGVVNVLFEYSFDYKMVQTKVRVHMKSSSNGEGIWIFIKRM